MSAKNFLKAISIERWSNIQLEFRFHNDARFLKPWNLIWVGRYFVVDNDISSVSPVDGDSSSW